MAQVASQHLDDTWTRHRSPLLTAMLVWYGEQPWGITPLAGSQGRTQHYDDVKMGAITSQITNLTIVYSTVYSDPDQRKHQRSASLAFVWGIHRDRWIPRTKGQLRGKCFHLMTSSWGTSEWQACDLTTRPWELYRRGALLFFQSHPSILKVTREKNHLFWPKFGCFWTVTQFQFTDGFEMMHKAWCGIEKVPHCFSRSSIKFQGHTVRKIDDLNPIWEILLGRS